ncbi:hypothetical protein I4Q36_06195 [Tuanshanicoccus lijuaniae]|uniref:hypothetical protein n=1 Tax=Aerococcaceae bacterium zg-1292 TaxID=2774330 RepID=UPI00193672AD|nr:hypothetical protein [Aerococcaceae bacterium zg-1292]QQA36409.1 hypothetical protein I4Q36_06195 [Aerococcaceae bacterium zg-1292]
MHPSNRSHFAERSVKCLPGNPGYPRCQHNPIVSTYHVIESSYSYIRNGSYVAKTVRAPGTVSISSSVTVNIEGLMVSTSYGASFNVPKGKFGNIVVAARIRNNVCRMLHKLKNGQVTRGGTFTKQSVESSWFQLKTW